MKYIYLLITLFILFACGTSEDKNVFDGSYLGSFGTTSVTGEVLTFKVKGIGEKECVIKNPSSTRSTFTCNDGQTSGVIRIEDEEGAKELRLIGDDWPIDYTFKKIETYTIKKIETS